ncbi:16S rRNA (guanine(966)-N(2))-methyltransferase RsmD [candidate division KSB1 bacterium]|nr:16S rRNA (guanine(966)-N(2))-methyltransferase RsmD [candidate division KSB1 bacterium]NIR71352.1 16S rRNA (guanine(966)-N(2))-methyltransferase RsmD [candidate division KSB1 bacterium]NIS26242.1 16S rRNA (guanine(966)-N(2))-methyltransferase RsmD [candidate division KSB1 bacterium]NIT74672.1 16S rRNA (guanine(966)-N(2))-methyltransferase RsmD [candidate division KSB1 bacterium]NIU26890.1 16S rRNA (guanine(966)-N(2))-methyltransferase RsmD [candidate division KSB1 bacterium]
MRIIAGEKKGLRLAGIKSRRIRPTTDRTKELIFDVVNRYLKKSSVLDIFAGSGSLGIEALSRGAAKAIFIEKNAHARNVLQSNLQRSGFQHRAEILALSAARALRQLASSSLKFDLIFADPPYDKKLAQDTVLLNDELELLAKEGWLIIEHHFQTVLSEQTKHFQLKTRKRQGDTTVSFYQNA